MQSEASGDVGTLFLLLERLGLHGWRDMNADDLTEEGMRQGVYDSDVFCLFLTNSVLSRTYILKEITWAIEFGKPVLMIVEADARFFAWDSARWMKDLAVRKANTWMRGWLQNTYADVCQRYPKVVELINEHLAAGRMIPYRRREFEANAMAHELVRRAAGTPWSWAWNSMAARAEHQADLNAARAVRVIADTATPAVSLLSAELQALLSSLSAEVRFDPSIDRASHVLVVLTGCMLHSGSVVEAELHEAVQHKCKLVFVYSTDCGWDFERFVPDSEAKVAVANQEALAFRPSKRPHEQRAMALELLRRMRPK